MKTSHEEGTRLTEASAPDYPQQPDV